ncbi:MAG TPA: hypothetical protein PKI73_00115 [Petrotogaceae bacterium]|jgi:hypothetical protein|nr:hypothetical protein [Petrotogaceae bacterium]HNY36374.1 hypothetical protein [Petrotogaceae bacterium]HPO27143.1 hypothetical protein [Petrotogaceae bacterium]HPX15266.1 hypothetical protein [Petrotogaceae bacterium]HQC40533.1 hypothetical protein [Petrotogaceae bacterium]
MKIDEKIINEIMTACLKDTRLFSIVIDISQKSEEERYLIRKKASVVLSEVNGVEKEALKFYYILTEDGVAQEIIRRMNDAVK